MVEPCLFVWVLFSKIWELPNGLFCHFLQKRPTNLAVLKWFCKKPNSQHCYFTELPWFIFTWVEPIPYSHSQIFLKSDSDWSKNLWGDFFNSLKLKWCFTKFLTPLCKWYITICTYSLIFTKLLHRFFQRFLRRFLWRFLRRILRRWFLWQLLR